MAIRTGDRVWYRYRVGGDPEQLEFTTPALVLHCPKKVNGAITILVFNQKTRRVIKQRTSPHALKPRSVKHALDADFVAYRTGSAAGPVKRGE